MANPKILDTYALNKAKEYLGSLYDGNQTQLDNFQIQFNEEGTSNTGRDAIRESLWQVNRSMWAAVELAFPSKGASAAAAEEHIAELEKGDDGDKRLAEAVGKYRNRGTTYGKLPAQPTADDALKYLENNFSQANGLRGPLDHAGKPSADWGRALDTVRKSVPHAYFFFFNILNKNRDPFVRWETAEDMLKKDNVLWPYYVWSVPGLNKQFPDVKRPMSSEEVSEARGVQGPSDKDVEDALVEEDKEKSTEDAADGDALQALEEATVSKDQDQELEQRISRDPDVAMGYFKQVLQPRGWRSYIITQVIRSNTNRYHQDEMAAFDAANPEKAKEEMTPSEALAEYLRYAKSGKEYTELEPIIAKDFSAIEQYVDQALAQSGRQSEPIYNGLKVGFDTNETRALEIAQRWSQDIATKLLTEKMKELAGSDPEKALGIYNKWKSRINSEELEQFMATLQKRSSSQHTALTILAKLEALGRKP